MYSANFCAECGEQINQAQSLRRFWTSRRFCAGCARRFRRTRFLWPLAASLALFGLGFAAGRTGRPQQPPLIIQRGQFAPAAPAANETRAQTETDLNTREGSPRSGASSSFGPDGTSAERPTDPEEIVSICGARTKKGTPCQRRVRGTGRCWQHRGLPAMLPPSKLILQE
ncbi:MAG TPA: hypothetical protein VGB17_19970 [Pyrinomonadaceae bacterium]